MFGFALVWISAIQVLSHSSKTRERDNSTLKTLHIDELPRPHLGEWAERPQGLLLIFRHGRSNIDPVQPCGLVIVFDAVGSDLGLSHHSVGFRIPFDVHVRSCYRRFVGDLLGWRCILYPGGPFNIPVNRYDEIVGRLDSGDDLAPFQAGWSVDHVNNPYAERLSRDDVGNSVSGENPSQSCGVILKRVVEEP